MVCTIGGVNQTINWVFHSALNAANLKRQVSSDINQRPDQYTCQVSVYLPSISILILILSILIFKYWYWYFLFQKRTEILILQYYFYHQYQYFPIFFNDLVTMFEATKIVWCTFIEALWLNTPISASFEL